MDPLPIPGPQIPQGFFEVLERCLALRLRLSAEPGKTGGTVTDEGVWTARYMAILWTQIWILNEQMTELIFSN